MWNYKCELFFRYSEERSPCNKVFDTKGLMRMKLTPDGTKMIICTTNGYMIVVHDLNLETMPEDLNDFKVTVSINSASKSSVVRIN